MVGLNGYDVRGGFQKLHVGDKFLEPLEARFYFLNATRDVCNMLEWDG